MTMNSFDRMIEENADTLLRQQHQDEIERAIKNAKRTAWDKWWRREWYRGTARIGWRHRRRRGPGRSQQPWSPVGAGVRR